VQTDIQTTIDWLEARLKALDGDLQGRLHASPIWREQDDLLRGVPASAGDCVTWLAALPELGTLDRRRSARWLGSVRSTVIPASAGDGA